MRQCPTCGADNDADARFCGACGSQLPPAARSIEARQPTRASTSPPRPRASESRPATPVADAAGRGVAATLEPSTMRVEPGGAAKAQIRIVNLSRVVDEFRVEPLGDAAAWTQAEPASISLFPGATGTVTLEVRPPRSVQARAGTIALAIRVRSVADASKEVYQQALVNIGAFGALTAGLVPRTSAGKRSATHELTIENQGNSLVQVRISASDPDRKLDFSIATPTLALEAAQARTVPIVVHARQGLMRGAPVTSPFQVVVDAPGADRITADAAFAQQPSLPSWIGRAIVGALALVGVLVLAVVVGPQLLGSRATAPPGGSATIAAVATPPGGGVTAPVVVPPTAGPVIPTPEEETAPPRETLTPEVPTPQVTPSPELTTPPPTSTPMPTPVPLACDDRPAEPLSFNLGPGNASWTAPAGTLACISEVSIRPPAVLGDRESGGIIVTGGDFNASTDALTVYDSPGGVVPNPAPAELQAGDQLRWISDCACAGYFALVTLVLHAGDGKAPPPQFGSALLTEPFQQDLDPDANGAPDLVFDGTQLNAATGSLVDAGSGPGGYSECSSKLSTAGGGPIPTAGLVDGSHICLRTDQGRVVSIRVNGSGLDALLELATYEL